MHKSAFTEAQITSTRRPVERGTPVAGGCRTLGRSEQTCSRWKRRVAGMGGLKGAACGSSQRNTARASRVWPT
jgi:transposase